MYNNKRQKDTRTLVREIFIEHPDWNARQIYDRYLVLIGDTNKAVTLNAVQKHVQELKEFSSTDEYKKLESPWHMGTLDGCHLPPEAIPLILLVQNYAELSPHPVLKTPPPQEPVTIRQARWIARFSYFYRDLKPKDAKKNLAAAQWLYHWSKIYSTQEIICELSGIPLDTSVLDKSLREGGSDFPAVAGNQWVLMHRDNSITVDSETEKQIKEKDGENNEGTHKAKE